MAITVDLVKNVLTAKYLTNADSTISVHSMKNNAGELVAIYLSV